MLHHFFSFPHLSHILSKVFLFLFPVWNNIAQTVHCFKKWFCNCYHLHHSAVRAVTTPRDCHQYAIRAVNTPRDCHQYAIRAVNTIETVTSMLLGQLTHRGTVTSMLLGQLTHRKTVTTQRRLRWCYYLFAETAANIYIKSSSLDDVCFSHRFFRLLLRKTHFLRACHNVVRNSSFKLLN